MTTAAGARPLNHSVIMSPPLFRFEYSEASPPADDDRGAPSAVVRSKTIHDVKHATRDASPTTSSAPSATANYFQVRFRLRRFTESESGISSVLPRNKDVAIVAMLRRQHRHHLR